MSNSSSSSSESSRKQKTIVNPQSNLKFGDKFKIQVSQAPNRHDTESGISSIDSKPSIKKATKTSDLRFNPQAIKKPVFNQGPVQRLRSFKYEQKKDSSSSSGELSLDSDKSSMINSAKSKLEPTKTVDPAVKTLNPEVSSLNANQNEKSHEPVLNHIPLKGATLPPVKPETQPNRPLVPKLQNQIIDPSIEPAHTNLHNIEVINVKEDNFQPDNKMSAEIVTRLEVDEKNIEKPELRSAKYLKKDKESSKSKSSESSESSNESLDSHGLNNHDDSEINIGVDKHNKNEPNESMSPEKSSNNNSSGNSSDFHEESSSINADDSIFNISDNNKSPSIIISTKRKQDLPDEITNEIENDSSHLNPIQNTPPFLFSVKFLTYNQLFAYIRNFSHQNESLYENESLCEKLCKCLIKSQSITPDQCQDLLKLQRLCYQTYDNSDEFHRYLLYSYYSRFTSRGDLNFDENSAKLIGLSCKDERKNELSKPFVLGSILHLIFLFENKPELIRTYSSAKRREGCTFINLCITLLTQSFNLLKRKKINQIFEGEQNAVQAFFEFHSGFIVIWAELSSTDEFTSSVREATSSASKNPMLCRQVFNK